MLNLDENRNLDLHFTRPLNSGKIYLKRCINNKCSAITK